MILVVKKLSFISEGRKFKTFAVKLNCSIEHFNSLFELHAIFLYYPDDNRDSGWNMSVNNYV